MSSSPWALRQLLRLLHAGCLHGGPSPGSSSIVEEGINRDLEVDGVGAKVTRLNMLLVGIVMWSGCESRRLSREAPEGKFLMQFGCPKQVT